MLAEQHAENGIAAQLVMVDEVLIAQRQAEHALPDFDDGAFGNKTLCVWLNGSANLGLSPAHRNLGRRHAAPAEIKPGLHQLPAFSKRSPRLARPLVGRDRFSLAIL